MENVAMMVALHRSYVSDTRSNLFVHLQSDEQEVHRFIICDQTSIQNSTLSSYSKRQKISDTYYIESQK